MSDFTNLNAAIATLTAQVEATEGTEKSAAALIAGFSTAITVAVTKALTDDEAADAGSIEAAQQAITDTTARFNASAAALGEAVTANPTPA